MKQILTDFWFLQRVTKPRPGATRGPSGAVHPQITARAPLNENCAPPKRELCPKELNRLGATGVQFEAWESQNTGYHLRIYE